MFLAMRMKRVLARESETLQQGLSDRRLEVRIELRAQAEEKAVRGLPGVVEADREIRAPLKRLVVSEIHGAGVLNQAAAGKHALKNAARCWLK